MSATELVEFVRRSFPESRAERFRIDFVDEGVVSFRYQSTADDLRPGDTVSGPTLMELSDAGMFLALLSSLGPGLEVATTNLNINFLRKPSPGELTVDTRLLKLGKRSAVGAVFVRSGDPSEIVSHATVTYALSAGQ